MQNKFNGTALTLARQSRGLTQTKLAKLLDIPQGHISRMEQETLKVSEDIIKKLESVLKYPKSFYFQNVSIYPPNLHYRKKTSVTVGIKEMAEATMNIYRMNIQKFLEPIELPDTNIPIINEDKISNPIDVAAFLRSYWKLPKGKIDNLTKLLESKGIIIIHCDFYTDKIDGRSMMTEKGQLIIFLNKNLSGDRQRYTIAHELAHLIMHIYSPDTFNRDVETEANNFASEFLMPQQEIRSQLSGKISIEKLADLKRYWKTSMQAILKWSQVLGITKDTQARYLWSQFNYLGIRKKEPLEITPETPSLVNQIIEYFISSLHYSKQDIANMVCLNLDEFEQKYFSQKPSFKVVR